jgi:hypothetical protein
VTDLVKIETHVDDALGRLLEQFREKPRLASVLSALVGAVQDTEDGLFPLHTERGVDVAIGRQLDVLGAIVGQPRAGLIDDIYRRYIRARIRTNRSAGRVNDLITVARLVLGVSDGTVEVTPQLPGAVWVRIVDLALDPDVSDVVLDMLFQAVAAGVRLLLTTSELPNDETFQFALGLRLLSANVNSGVVPIPVGSVPGTAGLPPTGTLIFAQHTALELRIPYILTTPTSFILRAPVGRSYTAGTMLTVIENYRLTDVVTTLDEPATAEDTDELEVASTDGFPDQGYLLLSGGIADEEMVTYAEKASNMFLISPAVQRDHAAGATVRLVTFQTNGFLDAEADTGGHFAGVRDRR